MDKQLRKALILTAGLGTRLLPLTENKPKALVELKNKTLLELAIRKIISSGIKDIIINVHHFADQITGFLDTKNNFGVNITISDERELLLDTGGGLKKASWFFDDENPFLVYNVDVLSDINLHELFHYHIQSQAQATLAVRERKSSRYLLFDNENILCGWRNLKTGEKITTRSFTGELNEYAFSGIQIISPEIFRYMPEEKIFSIIDLYLRTSEEKMITAYLHNDTMWMDLGNKNNFPEAEKFLQ